MCRKAHQSPALLRRTPLRDWQGLGPDSTRADKRPDTSSLATDPLLRPEVALATPTAQSLKLRVDVSQRGRVLLARHPPYLVCITRGW